MYGPLATPRRRPNPFKPPSRPSSGACRLWCKDPRKLRPCLPEQHGRIDIFELARWGFAGVQMAELVDRKALHIGNEEPNPRHRDEGRGAGDEAM